MILLAYCLDEFSVFYALRGIAKEVGSSLVSERELKKKMSPV